VDFYVENNRRQNGEGVECLHPIIQRAIFCSISINVVMLQVTGVLTQMESMIYLPYYKEKHSPIRNEIFYFTN
jgi:hypothetical protein